MQVVTLKAKQYYRWITIVSIVVPFVVALIFVYKFHYAEPLSILPPIYVIINGITAVFLVLAVVAIKYGK